MRRASLALLFAIAGCSSPPTVEAACDAISQSLCDKLNECAPFLILAGYGDSATCVTRTKLGCPSGFTAPGTSATTSQTVDCANALKTFTCSDLFATGKLPEPCRPKPGLVADGSACGENPQCKSTFCARAPGKKCGTCGPKPIAGTNCANLSECGEGLQCPDGSKICTEPGGAGAICDANHPCKGGLSCHFMGLTMSGVCETAVPLGGNCDVFQRQTAGCDFAKAETCQNGTCQKAPTATGGQMCRDIVGPYCIGSGTCKNGSCLAAAADGAQCDDTAGPKCMPPATCVAGACKIEDPASCK